MDLEPESSLVGTILDGRYEILEPVGDGGAGAVYRARQLHVDRDVAVKIDAIRGEGPMGARSR